MINGCCSLALAGKNICGLPTPPLATLAGVLLLLSITYVATATLMSTTSMHPGQTSRHALLISWLNFGWFCSKSTGLDAKHTITAFTELLMMPNRTLVTTRPTATPEMKGVATGSSSGDKNSDFMCTMAWAKQPVTPPTTKLANSRTFGTKSSETIVVHPRFSNNSLACMPASTNPYPYSPTYVNAHGLNLSVRLSTQDVMHVWMQRMH
mmetsp:Transcript_24605/g.69053  ORF Transcript_24605/g.69053 Transcript_24605/m.69053 type:complete len:209 (-) Transcript_24605:1893-2519(-)